MEPFILITQGTTVFKNDLQRLSTDILIGCCFHVLQDRSIAVWDMVSPTEINLRRVLVGHRAAVNVVDFDEKYIVSASGDRTIKVRFYEIYSDAIVR